MCGMSGLLPGPPPIWCFVFFFFVVCFTHFPRVSFFLGFPHLGGLCGWIFLSVLFFFWGFGCLFFCPWWFFFLLTPPSPFFLPLCIRVFFYPRKFLCVFLFAFSPFYVPLVSSAFFFFLFLVFFSPPTKLRLLTLGGKKKHHQWLFLFFFPGLFFCPPFLFSPGVLFPPLPVWRWQRCFVDHHLFSVVGFFFSFFCVRSWWVPVAFFLVFPDGAFFWGRTKHPFLKIFGGNFYFYWHPPQTNPPTCVPCPFLFVPLFFVWCVPPLR